MFSHLLEREMKRALGPVMDPNERVRNGPLLELEKRRGLGPSWSGKRWRELFPVIERERRRQPRLYRS